jgi:thiol:disulfide interchange protein
MPPKTPLNAPPKSNPLLIGIAVAVAIVLAVAFYYAMRPAPATSDIESNAPASPPAASAAPASVPMVAKHIYSETANPKADIAAALAQARLEHKRVIVDFGGDWCGDCQVLDIYFHQSPNAELLAKSYVLVHVWIGHMDANLDVPAKYGVPVSKGVPALAVLSPSGQTLYSQRNGEFEKMRAMDPASVTDFLNKWKS